jgi:hypothetical protein
LETPKPPVASPMVAGPPASRSTIPRRIGWARALKGSLAITLTISAGLRPRRALPATRGRQRRKPALRSRPRDRRSRGLIAEAGGAVGEARPRRQLSEPELRLVTSGFKLSFPRPCCEASSKNRMVDREVDPPCVARAGDGFQAGITCLPRQHKMPFCRGFYGSDGTRSRDLRRDRWDQTVSPSFIQPPKRPKQAVFGRFDGRATSLGCA